MQDNTELTKKATKNVDWFKFETRVRTIMKELLEVQVLRQKDIETENRKLKKKVELLNR